MVVGFTGSRYGMTEAQKTEVKKLLEELKPETFCHGSCIGSDAQAHELARELDIDVHVFPPNNNADREFVVGYVEIEEPKPYLVRNKNIVNASDCVIATPNTEAEQTHGGTWSTIAYTRTTKKTLYVILPSGKLLY